MKTKITIPGSIKNYTKTASYAALAFRTNVMSDTIKALSESGAEVKTSDSKRITATIGKLSNKGIIDLKPFFMNSPKAHQKKNGGWYLVIPINMSSRNIQKTSGRKTYDAIRQAFSDLGPNQTGTLSFNGLLSRVDSSLTLPSLVSPKPFGSLTATKSASGTRTSYIAFRTVSDKSAPQSWVINKKNVNQNDSSATLQREVGTLIRQRIRKAQENDT